MAVFRVERNKGYTVISNYHLRNKDRLDEIVSLIFETVCSKRKTICIARDAIRKGKGHTQLFIQRGRRPVNTTTTRRFFYGTENRSFDF